MTRTLPGNRPPPVDSKRERVEIFLHGLSIVLRHHDAPEAVVNSFYKQAYDYLLVRCEEIFLKRAKYLLLVPMARYLNNEPPEQPDLTFIPRGQWVRGSRCRLRVFRNKNTHLWYSFLQGKRGAAAVSSEIVLSNFRKHRKLMSSPDPIGETDEDDEFLFSIMDAVGPIIRRLATHLTGDLMDFFKDPGAERHVASSNSSFSSTRSNGGQLGYIRDLVRRRELFSSSQGDLISSYDRIGLFLQDKDPIGNPVLEVRGRDIEGDKLSELIYNEIKLDSVPRYNAQVEAVLEPLKVRTISKGPALPYYIGKPVQKAIHTRMREMAPFRLIGRPFCTTDLVDIRNAQERIGLGSDAMWLSIDYSSATDGLSATLSQEILSRILGKLAFVNPGLYNLLLGVLAPHHIVYPKVADVQLDSIDQENGQLMGSILSFPVLCLANLALYLLVRKTTRPQASMKDLLNAVLINGDDMIYIGTQAEWDLHGELGAKFGLAMKPGKAYIHKRYANINSISVCYPLDIEGSSPYRVGYLNVGLMVGNQKVLGRIGPDVKDSKTEMCSSLNELIDGAWLNKKRVILSQYLSRHRKILAKETRGRNLFLPVSAGGMGVNPPAGFKFFTTKRQREWMTGLLGKYPYLIHGIRPLPSGKDIGKVEDLMIDPLRVAKTLEDKPIRLPVGRQMDIDLGWFGFIPYRLSLYPPGIYSELDCSG